jgi:glycine/D-amino acid oxidase-like deaminating enzyme
MISSDILIFGGGIAGLWTLLRLHRAGYRAVLVESKGLGGVQTLGSQGIIHGGIKYSLGGTLSDSTRAIAEMPGRWRACLEGQGEIDLRQVKILAEHQHLWSAPGIMARMSTVIASQLLRGHSQALSGAELPEVFRQPGFSAEVYRLEEPVLDVPSLMGELARQAQGLCYQLPESGWRPLESGPGIALDNGQRISARTIILAAGAGNQALLQAWGAKAPKMQLRPLQMLLARGDLPRLYGHCLGPSNLPRLTISSHQDGQGRSIWYLGGQLAEAGAAMNAQDLIARGKAELAAILPWLDTSALEFASFQVNRAELAQPGGKRPDAFCAQLAQGLMTLWPTKLAFAPALADAVLQQLQEAGISPSDAAPEALPLPPAPMAQPPWEALEIWN